MQVDSLAQSRSADMNEATRRLLGVLLRFVDGFKATNSIIVAATNRKQDLDAALLSRCDTVVSFPLPHRACRAEILEHYAAHLSREARHSRLSMTCLVSFLKKGMCTSTVCDQALRVLAYIVAAPAACQVGRCKRPERFAGAQAHCGRDRRHVRARPAGHL